MQLGLMAGPSGMLDDDTQERGVEKLGSSARGRNAQRSEGTPSVALVVLHE
jgi:hypothetical protein